MSQGDSIEGRGSPLSVENEAAYQRYLQVFPCYWDPERNSPVSRADFLFFFDYAHWFKRVYDRDLERGILAPSDYWVMAQMGQFLGISRASKELAYAFKHGFCGEREQPSA